MKKLLGIVVLGLIIVAQSHAAEKETIVKSLLEDCMMLIDQVGGC